MKRSLGLAIAAALTIGMVQGVPAQAAPPPDPAAAEEAAREAASEEAPRFELPSTEPAPELDTTEDQDDPLPDDEFTAAWKKAQRTDKPVELESQTTETTISHVQPDGTVEVESTAGPARTKVGGDWVDVDTTLRFTDEGVQPTAVTGEITFSDGGADPMAVLGDGGSTEISLDWAGQLPKPVLDGDTATYRNVFPHVDLVLTATRLGFEQHLVVKKRPTPATLAQLRRLQFPMETKGARVGKGGGGELQVLDGAGAVIGTAAAPIMWDARTDKHTGGPVAVREIGMELASDGGLVLTPAEDFLTDPGTQYPVTIDPTQALGSLGDTFVQSNIANTAQGGSTEIRAGTYDGPTAARGYLKFDVTPLKNRVVQSATLSLFEFHSWSCSPRWVDIRNVGNFDPNTLTWGSQPAVGGIVANANVAYGYSTACPDNWVNFNLTSHAAHYANAYNGSGNIMPLGVFANEDDVYAWKKFNSGNSGVNVPKLVFTYDGNCDQYRDFSICGAIRTKWHQLGAGSSFLGLPTSDYTATTTKPGAFNHFTGGSIFWSSTTGAHVVRTGAMRDRWSALGWHSGYLGFPTGDQTSIPGGWVIHFQGGTMFWSASTLAKIVKAGPIRDKYQAMGWHTSFLGYPTSDQVTVAGGSYSTFQNGAIYHSVSGAYSVRGAIRDKWNAMGAQASWLGFPASDEVAVGGGAYQHFAGGTVYSHPQYGTFPVRGPIRDKYIALGGPDSSLGFPTTDEQVVMKTVQTTTTAPDGSEVIGTEVVATDGLHNDFAGGSITWSAAAGAHTLTGVMWDSWLQANAGGDSLGLPTTDEYTTTYGQRQDFEAGQLIAGTGTEAPTQCTITGTTGADHLTGTEGPDVICALDGDDVVESLGGDDAVRGDGGDDTIHLGAGQDAANGGPGIDTVKGESGDDLLIGDTDGDLLDGGDGSDTAMGGDGDDRLVGGDEADDLDGGAGTDILEAGLGNDVVAGGDGNDRLEGSAGADDLAGGAGIDTMSGGDGDDVMAGNGGDDVLIGDTGADVLAGGLGSDDLAGQAGSDTVDGGPSTDHVDGGDELDRCLTGDTTSTTDSCEDIHVSTGVDATAALVTALSSSEGALVPAAPVDGSYVMTGESAVVSAPVTAAGTVELSVVEPSTTDGSATATATSSIGIGLPLPDAGVPAVVADDGTVVYSDAQGAASVTVQSLTSGNVQVSTVLPSAAAPNRLRYDVRLPDGAWLEADGEGNVAIVSADGSIAGTFHQPWASDAAGVPVPTGYEIDGSALVQVVDLTRSDIVFPVVADPRLTFGWGVYLNMYGYEWKALSVVLKAAIGAASWVTCNSLTKKVVKNPWAWVVRQVCSVAPVTTVTTFILWVKDNWFGWMSSGSCYQVNLAARILNRTPKIVRVRVSGNCTP